MSRRAVTILESAIEDIAIPTIVMLGSTTGAGAVKKLRRAIIEARGADDAYGHPLCAECGRPGYRKDIGSSLTVVGHLDQRIKHSFEARAALATPAEGAGE